MTLPTRPLARIVLDERRSLLMPAAACALAVEVLILLQPLLANKSIDDRLLLIRVVLLSILYTLALFLFLFPLTDRSPRLHWAIAVTNAVTITILAASTPFSSPLITTTLAGVVVAISAILAGRGPTYLFILLNATLNTTLVEPVYPSSADGWLNLLSLPIMFFMLTETILRLGSALSSQMRRLETLNHIARRVASTIEIREVISLVSEAIQGALLADTYYVGILHGERLRLELLYDDGEFFPPADITLDDSLAGWVIHNKKSLLLHNVIEDMPKLGLKLQTVGQPRPSLSWMGTLLESGGHTLGMVAVASYHRNAFKIADLELLENVAQQAALAIDNAYHHAEVEDQSHHDSLTRVYTHGYFLERMSEEAKQASEKGYSLSLIMLDIDYFKQYNDHYGHLIGDQVLVMLAATIKSHIKENDSIGRWGGEEFAVLLRETTGEQAMNVAARIRLTLAEISLADRNGLDIPAPTVSQGIAVYPHETTDLECLIHLADQRLYAAKERGRNQIKPEVWAVEAVMDGTRGRESVLYT